VGTVNDVNLVSIYNRGVVDANNFVEAIMKPAIANLVLEKVYNDGTPHDVVLTTDATKLKNPLPSTAYEMSIDLDANSISARKDGNPIGAKGQLTAAIGVFKNASAPHTTLNSVVIGFQNQSAATNVCIIYLPIVITSN
jgi:hypothetical protein